jgi:hypothetical protein
MTKRFPALLTIALVFGAPMTLTFSEPADAAPSYPLTCQIGAPNALIYVNGFFLVTFEPSSGPASHGLQPGQCAWADRAVGANEPHNLGFPATITGANFKAGALVNQSLLLQGPGGALATAAAMGTPKLMTFMVHASPGIFANLTIDSYGP